MTSDDAIALINSGEHDIFLLDLNLGKEDGLSLLEYINTKNRFIPLIFLTAQGDQEKAVEAMKAGAHGLFDQVEYFCCEPFSFHTICYKT